MKCKLNTFNVYCICLDLLCGNYSMFIQFFTLVTYLLIFNKIIIHFLIIKTINRTTNIFNHINYVYKIILPALSQKNGRKILIFQMFLNIIYV